MIRGFKGGGDYYSVSKSNFWGMKCQRVLFACAICLDFGQQREREREIVAAKCTMAWAPIKYIYEACNVCHSFAIYLGEREKKRKKKKKIHNVTMLNIWGMIESVMYRVTIIWLHNEFVEYNKYLLSW